MCSTPGSSPSCVYAAGTRSSSAPWYWRRFTTPPWINAIDYNTILVHRRYQAIGGNLLLTLNRQLSQNTWRHDSIIAERSVGPKQIGQGCPRKASTTQGIGRSKPSTSLLFLFLLSSTWGTEYCSRSPSSPTIPDVSSSLMLPTPLAIASKRSGLEW